MSKDKRVLVAGASGFVGSHLTDYLKNSGYVVGAIVRDKNNLSPQIRQEINYYEITNTDYHSQLPDVFKKFQPNVTINCITNFLREDNYQQISRLVDANILLPSEILQNCYRFDSKYLNISSFWQWGVNKKPLSRNLYASTKNSFDVILDYFFEKSVLPVTSVILKDTYGFDDKRDKIFNKILKAQLEEKSIELSSPKNLINLTHILDVVSGIENLINFDQFDRYYQLSSKSVISLSKLVSIFDKYSHKNLDIVWNGEENYESNILAKVMLSKPPKNWIPTVSIDDGIKDILRKNFEKR